MRGCCLSESVVVVVVWFTYDGLTLIVAVEAARWFMTRFVGWCIDRKLLVLLLKFALGHALLLRFPPLSKTLSSSLK